MNEREEKMRRKVNVNLIGTFVVIFGVLLVLARLGLLGSEALAVVCPTCGLGDVYSNGSYVLENTICLDENSAPIRDLRLRYVIYGPNANEFPCLQHSVYDSSLHDFNYEILPGECKTAKLGIDVSQLPEGNNYHLLIFVYDGQTLVKGLRYTANDDEYYQQCFSSHSSELLDPVNNCGIDPETGKYWYCEQVAWSFNVKSPKQEEHVSYCFAYDSDNPSDVTLCTEGTAKDDTHDRELCYDTMIACSNARLNFLDNLDNANTTTPYEPTTPVKEVSGTITTGQAPKINPLVLFAGIAFVGLVLVAVVFPKKIR